MRREVDVDEHIQNISSYDLSSFQKLVLCRGLKFAIPQHPFSAMDVQANFEKTRSINQLKKRSDIVISKPDKGSGVVVMDKSD